MDLDEVIKQLEDPRIDCITFQNSDLTAWLRELRDAREDSGWINVDDRLPENNKLVLCYAQSTTGEGCCYILGTLSNDEFWFLQAHDGHHLSFPNLHLVVTHWQPLPEPPVNL